MNEPMLHIKTTAKFESISPQKAARYLKMNTSNRRPSPKYISYIADQMKRGNFVITGQTISFRYDGVLIDGQQRLMACVEAGVSFFTWVIRGLGDDAFHGTDIGKGRSAADITGLDKSLTEIIKAYNVYILGGKSRMSHADIMGVYEPRAVHFDNANMMRPHKKGIGVAPLWAAVVRYSEASVSAANQFSSALIEPANVIQVNVLKEWLYQQKTFTGGMAQREVVRRALYCMDAHFRGKSTGKIQCMEVERAFT
jgi:hypothetical protein